MHTPQPRQRHRLVHRLTRREDGLVGVGDPLGRNADKRDHVLPCVFGDGDDVLGLLREAAHGVEPIRLEVERRPRQAQRNQIMDGVDVARAGQAQRMDVHPMHQCGWGPGRADRHQAAPQREMQLRPAEGVIRIPQLIQLGQVGRGEALIGDGGSGRDIHHLRNGNGLRHRPAGMTQQREQPFVQRPPGQDTGIKKPDLALGLIGHGGHGPAIEHAQRGTQAAQGRGVAPRIGGDASAVGECQGKPVHPDPGRITCHAGTLPFGRQGDKCAASTQNRHEITGFARHPDASHC